MTARVVGAIAAAAFADALRRKVSWIVVVFAAVLAVTIPSLPSYGVGVAGQVFREVAQALMFVAAMVLALALSVNRIPGEVERRTVYGLLARDVRRWHYVAGGWLGVFGVLAASVAAFCVVCQGVAVIVYSDPMWQLWQGGFAVLLQAGVVAAFATAVSVLVGPVTVVVASLAFLFLGHARDSVLAVTGAAVVRLVPSLDAFNVVTVVAHGEGYSLAYAASMSAVFVAWVALLLTAASIAFDRKDL